MKIAFLMLAVGLFCGVIAGKQLAYREAVDADAAIWVYPEGASEHSPGKRNWFPTLQWRPASTLKPPVIRPEDPQEFPDSGRIS